MNFNCNRFVKSGAGERTRLSESRGCGAGAAGGRPRGLPARRGQAVTLTRCHLRASIRLCIVRAHHGARLISAVERNQYLTAWNKSVRTAPPCTGADSELFDILWVIGITCGLQEQNLHRMRANN